MRSNKKYVAHVFNNKPKRYGIDDGDLNIVNDYFASMGWQTFTREQFAAIASLIRTRNKFMADNPQLDFRTDNKPSPYVQFTIYDFLDGDTATQTKKLTRYFTGDEKRLQQSVSRIKKSVRGVDTEHITAAKVYLPLFVSEPKLKKMRVNRRQPESPTNGTLDGVSVDFVKANISDGVVGL